MSNPLEGKWSKVKELNVGVSENRTIHECTAKDLELRFILKDGRRLSRAYFSNTDPDREVLLHQRLVSAGADMTHVGRYLGHTQDERRVKLALEYCAGEELFSLVISMFKTGMPPDVARPIFLGVVRGAQSLHRHQIAHLDLSVENVIVNFDEKRNVDSVKLIDLGHARMFEQNKSGQVLPMRVGCPGKPSYRAPELDDYVLGQRKIELKDWYVDPVKADVFSLGAILFVMLAAALPWKSTDHPHFKIIILDSANDIERRKKVGREIFTMWKRPEPSDSALDLIARCWAENPKERPTLEQILEHEWLKDLKE